MQEASRSARRLLAVLFAAGLLIILDQAADLLATVLSRQTDMAAPNWRFGLFGLITSRTTALVLGDAMIFTAVIALGWRGVLQGLAALHLLLAASAVAGVVVFLLDAVQVRGTVPPQSTGAFSSAVFRAGVVALAATVTLGWAGVAAWRSARSRPRSGRHDPDSLLVAEPKQRHET